VGVCDGTGWLVEHAPVGHPNFAKLVPCQCKIAARAQHADRARARALEQLSRELGGELASCTFESYDLDRALDERARASMHAALLSCLAFAHKPVGWLYLHGPTGVGKSHLASAVARSIADHRHVSACYASEPALMAFIRAGWDRSSALSADERIANLQEADLLIIDDIGTAHRPKGDTAAWVDAQLFDVLHPRYQYSRATILTSNLPPSKLEQRLASRISGRATVLHIDNTDQRGVRR